MEKIASDLKASELKQISICKAYEALHSEASTILLLTLQWKDLDDHFNMTRKTLQEKFEELSEREKNVEAREKRLEEEDLRLTSEIGLKSKRLDEIERAIEVRGKEFGLIGKEVGSLDSSIQEKRRELEIATMMNISTRKSVAEREKELDKLDKEIKDRAKKLDSLERSVKQRSEEVESKGKELSSIRGMWKKCRDDLVFKERKLHSVTRYLEDHKKELEMKEEQLKICRSAICDCDREIKLREERLQTVQDSIVERSIELEMREKQVNSLHKDFELKRRNFVSLKKSMDQCAWEFDAKERRLEGLKEALELKEMSSASEIEELGLVQKRVKECLNELELKKKNLASLQRLVEERFHEVERRESQLEVTQKEFDSIRNTLAFRLIVKPNALDSRVKIEQSDNADNSDDFLSFARYQYCISNGHFLRVLLGEQLKKQDSLSTDIFSVLQRSPNPAKLVLDAVQGFYPLHPSKENTSYDLGIMRSGCILLLEQLMKAAPAISPQVREEAMKLAGDWKAKMAVNSQNFLEVLGLVQLLASYGLAYAFDADELRSLLDIVSASRQASEIRRTLGVADKTPVNTKQAENSMAIANIATSSPNAHSSEGLNGKSMTQDDILTALQMLDPAKHVLGIVEESFSQRWKRGDAGFEAHFMKSYVFMFEQLLRNSPQIQPLVREDAMKLATEWIRRIRANIENSMEILGFLQFLAVYGLASSFKQDDISDFLEIISQDKHALELSGTLGFAYEIPEFIENLLGRNRNLEAIRLTFAFNLTDKFSPTKLLTEHMEKTKSYFRQCGEGKSSIEEKDKVTDKEIAALRAVVQCIRDYNMESQFQSDNILKRIALLEKIKNDRRHSALFFRSSNEQRQQPSCNKRRNSTLSPVEQPQQKREKICPWKALSTAKHHDLPVAKPVLQQTNSSSKLHGSGAALAAGKSNVVLGVTSGGGSA